MSAESRSTDKSRVFPTWDQVSSLSQPLTPGETALARFLDDNLPPEWEIYLQPYLNGGRPDIIVFNPAVGLIIYEVKDWNLDNYTFGVRDGRPQLFVRDERGSHPVKNPVDQVNHYRAKLIELLVPRLGEQIDQNRQAFALVKVGLYFHRASEDEALALFQRSAGPYIPVLGQDSLHGARLIDVAPSVAYRSSKFWDRSLNDEVRFWLHPPYHSIEQGIPIAITDEQRRHAEPQAGHFRLRGVVGSGKTQVIAYRAAKLASENLDVLVVTFNITLGHYIRDMIKRVPLDFSWRRITVIHFHGFCKEILNEVGEEWPQGAGDETFFQLTIPMAVETAIDGRSHPTYDAILIDEGQDFYIEWYHLLTKFLRPRNELFLVCDKKQNIYSRELTWIDGSMRGLGTQFRGAWRELKTIFRLPDAVASAANRFAQAYDLNQEVSVERIVQPTLFDRVLAPHLIWRNLSSTAWLAEVDDALDQLRALQASPSDIVVLVPHHEAGLACVRHFSEKGIAVNHVFGKDDDESRRHKRSFWMGDGRLKVSTVHSFKGWEVLNVVLYIPPGTGGDMRALDAVVYTAMTRTRENLVILNEHPRYREFGGDFTSTWTPH